MSMPFNLELNVRPSSLCSLTCLILLVPKGSHNIRDAR